MIPQAQAQAADDYFLYANWNPGVGYTTGVAGYIDTNGNLGDPGDEYIIFAGGPSYCGGHTAYIYRVDEAGDPNIHPDNPEATGPVSPRTFTLVSSYYMGSFCSGHENAFYVDDTGIYYGAAPGWGGIYHWDFDWTPIGWDVTTPAPATPQTFARNPDTGDWWVGLTFRQMYKWDVSSWKYQFTHPSLAGGHHNGMEIIGDSLFISDMTSDKIIQYRLDSSGNVIDPPNTPYKTFTYSASPPVEGMGFGPNKHIWISGWSSGTVYELGGGKLQVALEGIKDQCILAGESFEKFDLDDYVVGKPPFTWTYSGNVELGVNIDQDNIVSITYPAGWTGSEKITFEVTDSEGNTASDDATFNVDSVPVVGDIPDQNAPFETFDLDDYLTGVLETNLVVWSTSYNGGAGWDVNIDVNNVVTVTPNGASNPLTITFNAKKVCCEKEVSSSDAATFDPVAVQQPDLGAEKYRWSEWHDGPDYKWDPAPIFHSWNDVFFTNKGSGEAKNVVATISCKPINVQIIDGQVTLGDIPAGGQAWSKDFYEILTNLGNPQDPNIGVEWTVEYDDTNGDHHEVVVSQHRGKASNCSPPS